MLELARYDFAAVVGAALVEGATMLRLVVDLQRLGSEVVLVVMLPTEADARDLLRALRAFKRAESPAAAVLLEALTSTYVVSRPKTP